MPPFNEYQHFAGLIAAGTRHAVAVLDRAGVLTAEFEFGEFGWREFQEKLDSYPGTALAAEALEGHVLDQLFLRGLTFFPVTPANMSAHLEQSPQPEEENPRSDARVLAEALRVHGQGWKTMTPQDPLLENFRGFWAAEKDCRRRVDQVEEQFLEMVEEAFPEVLPVFEWTSQSPAWEFIERYPGAAALRRVGARDLETFLRGHDLWETPCGGRCRALLAGARKKSGDPAQSRVVEEKLRETAKTLREARELAGKLQFQSAAILQLHPDFAFFGPAPGSEGEIGGPGEPRFSPA